MGADRSSDREFFKRSLIQRHSPKALCFRSFGKRTLKTGYLSRRGERLRGRVFP
jgi:hypothetical protein